MSFSIVLFEMFGIDVNMTIKPGCQPGKFNSFDRGGIFKWTCLEHMLKNEAVLKGMRIALDSEVREGLSDYILDSTEWKPRRSYKQVDILDGDIIVGISRESGEKSKCFRVMYELVVAPEVVRIEIVSIFAIDDTETVLQEESSAA